MKAACMFESPERNHTLQRSTKDDVSNMQKNKIFLSGAMSCLITKANLRYLAKTKGVKIWRTKDQAFAVQNLIPTVKHSGGSVMVWGCMAAGAVGNLVFIKGTMNNDDYLMILRENLPPSVEKYAWVNAGSFNDTIIRNLLIIW